MVQEVEASRSLSLEELPPILILHLKRFVKDNDLEWTVDVEKLSLTDLWSLILYLPSHVRFVYSGTSGGCQKGMKQGGFSVDLEISRELLSGVTKTKYTAKQRQYKLFAVVYHTGREATKGHYVADVYHTGNKMRSFKLSTVHTAYSSLAFLLYWLEMHLLVL